MFWFGRGEIWSLSFSLSLDSYSFSTDANASIYPIGESFLEKWQFSLEKTSFDSSEMSFRPEKTMLFCSNGITMVSYHMRRISDAIFNDIYESWKEKNIGHWPNTHHTSSFALKRERIKLARILLSPRLWSVSVTPHRSQAKQAREWSMSFVQLSLLTWWN